MEKPDSAETDGFTWVGTKAQLATGYPHLHFHILPRYKGDGGGSVHSIIKIPGYDSGEKWRNFLNYVKTLENFLKKQFTKILMAI